ncbi:lipopolysaccharide biosynthesis protein [Sphingomonas aracearum]|uniref:Lipopolysaccharide biosynthesis protein n=1 Tax=Sphingomonas aracearum TaxID=2283317 RepID=A0A369VUB6_9SPHN|nr:oligosaccharide flippase family protein [Sphingomonas aracearum]RDE05683.1 lipopolysaccharide biosynthesis protein [Sphingomonas aracearum]
MFSRTKVTQEARPGGMRAVLRNLGWLLASRGVLALFSLLYLAIATRTLGIQDFGRFALITGAAQGLATLVGFQTWQVVVRYGTDHLAPGGEKALGRLYRACVLLDAGSALAGIVLAAAILAIWHERLGIPPALMRDAMIFTVAQLATIRSAAIGILRLSDRFGQAAAADSVTPLVRLLGAVAAAVFAPTLHAFLWAWSAAELATGAAYWWLLVRNGDGARIWGARLDRRALASENPQLGRFLLSSNLVSSLGLATKQVPLLLVGGFAGPAAAGAFRLALQLAQALAKLAQLIARAAFPEVVRAVRRTTPAEIGPVLGRMFLASGSAGLVILAVIALLGRPVLVLVGGDLAYAAAYSLLLWLAAAGCIDLAVVAFEPVLLAANRSATAVASRAAGIVLQIAVSLALLPRIGAAGASIGVFASSLLGALLLGATVLRYARSGTRA